MCPRLRRCGSSSEASSSKSNDSLSLSLSLALSPPLARFLSLSLSLSLSLYLYCSLFFSLSLRSGPFLGIAWADTATVLSIKSISTKSIRWQGGGHPAQTLQTSRDPQRGWTWKVGCLPLRPTPKDDDFPSSISVSVSLKVEGSWSGGVGSSTSRMCACPGSGRVDRNQPLPRGALHSPNTPSVSCTMAQSRSKQSGE